VCDLTQGAICEKKERRMRQVDCQVSRAERRFFSAVSVFETSFRSPICVSDENGIDDKNTNQTREVNYYHQDHYE
jgi:hypothetical protein